MATQLPSPHELMGKVLLKGKVLVSQHPSASSHRMLLGTSARQLSCSTADRRSSASVAGTASGWSA